MTYRNAKLIVWNHAAYTRAEVREAAIFILGCLTAQREDVDQASALL
jgi:hypothetical protein